MKKITKITSLAVLFALLVSFAAVFAGCTPAKMSKVVGTYELIIDTNQRYEEETVDRIAEYGVKSYLVLTDGDYGYYIYEDKYTSVTCKTVKLSYNKNDDDKITSVTYTADIYRKTSSYNVDARDGTVYLVARWPSASKLIDAYERQYKKVSKATDLSYVKTVYKGLRAFPYATSEYNRLFYAEIAKPYANYSDYIYKFYDLDVINGKATLYYALKSDLTPITEENLTLTFVRNEQTSVPEKIKISGVEFEINDLTFTRDVTVPLEEGITHDGQENMYAFYDENVKSPEDYDAYFLGLIEEYRSSSRSETEQ